MDADDIPNGSSLDIPLIVFACTADYIGLEPSLLMMVVGALLLLAVSIAKKPTT